MFLLCTFQQPKKIEKRKEKREIDQLLIVGLLHNELWQRSFWWGLYWWVFIYPAFGYQHLCTRSYFSCILVVFAACRGKCESLFWFLFTELSGILSLHLLLQLEDSIVCDSLPASTFWWCYVFCFVKNGSLMLWCWSFFLHTCDASSTPSVWYFVLMFGGGLQHGSCWLFVVLSLVLFLLDFNMIDAIMLNLLWLS